MIDVNFIFYAFISQLSHQSAALLYLVNKRTFYSQNISTRRTGMEGGVVKSVETSDMRAGSGKVMPSRNEEESKATCFDIRAAPEDLSEVTEAEFLLQASALVDPNAFLFLNKPPSTALKRVLTASNG